MKSKYLTALACAALCCSPWLSHASDGAISFAGELSTSTCTISGPASFTVVLPTISANSLANESDAAGATPFSIAVASCSAGLTGANIYFERSPTVEMGVSFFLNKGTATNVALHVVLEGDKPVDPSRAYTDQSSPNTWSQYAPKLSGNIQSNTGRLNFHVSYVNIGDDHSVTPGTVTSNAVYTMIYN